MAKRKRAPLGIRWAFLQVGLEYMLTGKLPRPKRKKSTPKRKARKVSVDASKGRKRIPKSIAEL